MTMSDAVAIVIISHGSPRAETNRGFESLVARVAARLPEYEIAPAFFSIVRPDIGDQVAALASRGAKRILLLPYFLYSGQHVTVDIPVLLDECRRRFPHLVLDFLPTLENDPVLENLLVERLAHFVASDPQLTDGSAAPGAREQTARPTSGG